MNFPISDQLQRSSAIDPDRSFIVQAPAGSGKTELLIQRYLALLARVETPQQILAITFTRKAAAEMRNRLLDALASAQFDCPEEKHKAHTWQLAYRALKRDHDCGWNISQNPALLAIQTIDSFNSSLVRKMPWLSRFGGLPELANDPDQLYQKATERLLKRLGSGQPGSESLKCLLAHLDNNVNRLQKMLVAMLQKRDQWLRHLYGIQSEDPCSLLESALGQVVERDLAELTELIPPLLEKEILGCGRIAAANLALGKKRALLCLTDLDWFPGAESGHLPLWKGLADLLLAGGGTLRKPKGINAGIGFPAADKEPRQRMQELIAQLEDFPEFIEKLNSCRRLPETEYTQEQRKILACLFELLPLLVGELWLIFRTEGQTDYAEIALMAKAALGSVEDPSDLLLKLDSRLEHILVDEFQDTSWMQYGLLEMLTAGWQSDDGRSLFLVGDPMQSIYRFREAEVGLFLKSFEGRLGDQGVVLEPLRLSCNFRAQAGLVDWVNQTFATIFPDKVDAATGSVPLAPAAKVNGLLSDPAVTLTAFNGRDDLTEGEKVSKLVATISERHPEHSIAILVRGRSHLPLILKQLRDKGLGYQAQDIEYLGAQPVALDLLALARALVYRADRLAWLTVLRAPWCGLTLADLLVLTEEFQHLTLPAVLRKHRRIAGLSADGKARISRIWPILERGLERQGRFNLRQLIEACWLSLGGPACYNKEGVADAALVFDLLESLQQGGDMPTHKCLEEGLTKLFAVPDTEASSRLQVMTIHKAKGLEFDHVILPGLGRMPAGNDSRLLRWLEHPQAGLLLAPIAAKDGSDQDPIYQYIGRLEREKQDLEASRLLYVAVTRARQYLHLFAHAKENSNGDLLPAAGSLLAKLWPVLEPEFCLNAFDALAEEAERAELRLSRLSLDWSLPEPRVAPTSERQQLSKASSHDETELPLFFTGWEQQTRRHIGTLVHQLLEKIGKQGQGCWQGSKNGSFDVALKYQLLSLGVPGQDLDAALKRIRESVDKTLASSRGCWILHNHADAASEMDISGQVNGQIVHAVIDRTFIDDQGVRWVIDYKTSTPKAGEEQMVFLERETDHYRSQLAVYTYLMKSLDPQHEVRSALYFPLIDQFVVVESDPG